jgi:hypothetical protein
MRSVCRKGSIGERALGWQLYQLIFIRSQSILRPAAEIGDTGVTPLDLGIFMNLSFRSDGTLFDQVDTKGDVLLGTINIQREKLRLSDWPEWTPGRGD